MTDINKLFTEMLELVMSLNDIDSFTKVYLTISFKRNLVAKEIEMKKNLYEVVKGKFLANSKDKIAAEKVQSTLMAGSAEAVALIDEMLELEEVRKMFQNTLDALLLRKDLYIAERKAGI